MQQLNSPRRSIRFFLLVVLWFIPALLPAQDMPWESGQRPKIGLALSGGGAKGIAHIGVLKVLEELGIQPDYITGTSMGSIVAAYYSIGYSAHELDSIIRVADWSQLLSNNIPLEEVVMEEKHEYERFMVELPVKENFKVGLPSGVIEGQKLANLFSGLTWRTAGIESFDDYPIPYHCMAVDLLSGEPIELSSGDLSTAIRASMAIPGIFTPVEMDGMRLVDGGIIRNFPVEEIRRMGADIVIGVYVGTKEDAESLTSMGSIVSHITFFLGAFDSKTQMKLVDYLVEPNLEGYSAGSFDDGPEIIARGEEAARSVYDQLKRLAEMLDRYPAPPPRKKLPQNDSLYVTEIEVKGLEYIDEELVRGRAGFELPRWLTPAEVDQALDDIFGTLYFRKINYYLEETDRSGAYRLVFNAAESDNATLRANLHYDNDYGAGVALNLTLRNFLLPGSRLLATGDISASPQFRANYFKYLGKYQNLVGEAFFHFETSFIPLNDDDGRRLGAFDQNYIDAGLRLGYNLNQRNQLGLGAHFELSSLIPEPGLRNFVPLYNFKRARIDFFAFDAYYRHHSFNDHYFPTSGSEISLRFKAVAQPELHSIETEEGADSVAITLPELLFYEPYFKLTFSLSHRTPLGARFSLMEDLSFGTTFNTVPPFTDGFIFGGTAYTLRNTDQAFWGFRIRERYANSYWMLRLGLQYEPWKDLFLKAAVNTMGGAFTLDDLLDDPFSFNEEGVHIFGYGLSAGYRTRLGPLEAVLMTNNFDQRLRFFFNIGFDF